MPARGEQLVQLPDDYRARLVIGAADQAIPGDLRPDHQRAALNEVIDSLEKRREALVVDKIVREALEDLPIATNFPLEEAS